MPQNFFFKNPGITTKLDQPLASFLPKIAPILVINCPNFIKFQLPDFCLASLKTLGWWACQDVESLWVLSKLESLVVLSKLMESLMLLSMQVESTTVQMLVLLSPLIKDKTGGVVKQSYGSEAVWRGR